MMTTLSEKLRRCAILFWTFARIALFVLGGGLAMLPVIEETFAVKRKLLTEEEVLDMVAVSQTIPGVVAANCAVYVGMKVAGFLGAVSALAGAVLPSFVIILLIAVFFPSLDPQNPLLVGLFNGVRAAVTALIVCTAYRMFRKNCRAAFEIALAMAALVLILFHVPSVWIFLGAIPLGMLALRVRMKKEDGK